MTVRFIDSLDGAAINVHQITHILVHTTESSLTPAIHQVRAHLSDGHFVVLESFGDIEDAVSWMTHTVHSLTEGRAYP